MAGLNKQEIIGNLGNDPEMRFTPNGKAVTSFNVAVNEGKDTTEWFNVEAWNKTAENCNQFLSKGSQVYVEGRRKTETWEGNDGKPRSKFKLIASKVVFLSKQSDRAEEPDETELEPVDIPF